MVKIRKSPITMRIFFRKNRNKFLIDDLYYKNVKEQYFFSKEKRSLQFKICELENAMF